MDQKEFHCKQESNSCHLLSWSVLIHCLMWDYNLGVDSEEWNVLKFLSKSIRAPDKRGY